jgi:putative tryptophan/tyrosine transport system substrate-binding protein
VPESPRNCAAPEGDPFHTQPVCRLLLLGYAVFLQGWVVHMQRRQFIGLLGGAAATWPLAVRAQQGGGMRRIGVLMNQASDDLETHDRSTALQQGLQQLGWIEGRNVRLDIRYGASNPDNARKGAAELVALAPDVILASGVVSLTPLVRRTRTIPIVFAITPDPVGAGFVDSVAQPGGNVTGFMLFEYSLSGKWLELLKEIAPTVTRAAILRDSATSAGVGQFAVIQAMAPSVGVDVRPVNVNDPVEIERRIIAFAQSANGGLIVTASALSAVHRNLIAMLAARHKLPSVCGDRDIAAAGVVVSYGPNLSDQFRQAAGYVDRILKGEKPADLPVQAPTRYELIINMKTAKQLGLAVPPTLLARADEVIE